MRFLRLLIILGPAAVLYVLAARAPSTPSALLGWTLGLSALAFALSPLVLLRGEPARRGSGRLGFMGACLAVASASAQSAVPAMGVVHALAWLCAALTGIDLALHKDTRRAVRGAIVAGAVLLMLVLLAYRAPLAELCVPVLIAGIGVLHYVELDSRQRTLEGLFVSLACVGLGTGLAAVWLHSGSPLVAAGVEIALAAVLWLGHLAWVDPRWSHFHRSAPPFALACVIVLFLSTSLLAGLPPKGWAFGAAVLGLAVLWWFTYGLADRFARRFIWRHLGSLSEVARTLRRSLPVGGSIEDISSCALTGFARAFGDSADRVELYTFRPPLRASLAASRRAMLRSIEAPPPIQAAVLADPHSEPFDLLSLRRRIVREPALRELAMTMEQAGIGCVLPCAHEDDVEAVLLLPLAARDEALTRTDLEALSQVAALIGAACSAALAGRRAQSHINELSSLNRAAEERIAELENELAQLRGQCDLLGKGKAEDDSLHVAYSASMRRVQTRAIEIAALDDPVMLEAPAGAPVLPIASFMHDRGPRWAAPFVVGDCSALEADLQSSMLLGSESEKCLGWLGSAASGTLLLRDLPALSSEAQEALATALERQATSQVDDHHTDRPPARIIATSRLSLLELERRKALHPALCEWFGRHVLSIPALCERREDLSSLVLLAIDRACRVLGREPVGIRQDTMAALLAHDWPGDVAELGFVIETAVARARGRTIEPSDLPPLAWPREPQSIEPLDGTYVEVERRMLERALERAAGNKSKAARLLGLKRTTFLDKLRRHSLEDEAPVRSALG